MPLSLLTVQEIIAGANISVDNTNPNRPIVSATAGGGGQVNTVVSGTNITVNSIDPVNPIVNLNASITGMTVNGVVLTNGGAASSFLNATGAYSVPPVGGQVNSVVAGAVIAVNSADPVNPIVNTSFAATARFLGRITGGAGVGEELTGTQATTLLDVFTAGLKGLATPSGGGTTNFLRADGSWVPRGQVNSVVAGANIGVDATDPVNPIVSAAAPGGQVNTVVSGAVISVNSADPVNPIVNTSFAATARFLGRITAGAGNGEELTGTQATTLLDNFTSALKGLAPASGGGTANFLRADGTWAVPPGTGSGSPGGADTQIQYNNAAAFGGVAGFTFNGTLLTLPATITFTAGSATAASWPVLPSGTLLTAAVKGTIEHDTNCLYFTTDNDNRGYVPVCHFTRCDSSFALANSAAEQAMFPAAQDTLTLELGTYKFEGMIALTGMSATSGNISIDPVGAGTAVTGTWLWAGWGRDAAIATVGAIGGVGVITQQSAAAIVTAATATEVWVRFEGTFEVTTAGTMIPSLTMLTASAATMRAGSYIMFERIGSTTVTNVGQWT